LGLSKRQKKKNTFCVIVIVLAVSLFVVGLVGYWAGHLSTSNRIDELESQFSMIQGQISSYQKSLIPWICNEKPTIKQGAMDKSFLLDTVRHISSNRKF